MPASRRAVIVAVLTFAVGLISLFPARIAYRWFAPAELVLSGIEGSIWRGRAQAANVAGVYLADTGWRARLIRLLTGKLAFAIESRPVAGFVDAEVAVGLGGSVHVRDLRASIPLAALEQATGVKGIGGTLNAAFDRLQLADGLPVAADGTVEVSSLLLPLVSTAPIGGFKATFFTADEGVAASVEDTDASVDLAGSFALSEDRSYRFLGKLAPKPETPRAIRRQMRLLGSADERGQHELRLEGSL